MNKKLLNKVMKKLASSNVVISPTVKSSSTSLSMQKKPETEQVQQKLEQYLLSRYHFRFNLLTEQTDQLSDCRGIGIFHSFWKP